MRTYVQMKTSDFVLEIKMELCRVTHRTERRKGRGVDVIRSGLFHVINQMAITKSLGYFSDFLIPQSEVHQFVHYKKSFQIFFTRWLKSSIEK